MAYGYKKRYGGKKSYRKGGKYRKGRKFGRKMKVPGGMKMVPSATYRSGGAYSLGQNAGHELKYLDSSLYNSNLDGTNPATFNIRSAGGIAVFNPSGTNTDGAYLAFDTSLNQQPVLLNNPITGTDATNRLGRKINIRSYLLRICARLTEAAGATGEQSLVSGISQCVRVVVVWDKQPNGGIALANQVFSDVSSVAAGDPQNEAEITSAAVMQLNNRDRFVVLSDDRANLSCTGASEHTFEIRRNVNLETVYSAIAPSGQAGIAQIASGSLLAFFLGEVPKGVAGPAANPSSAYAVSCMARIRFYDA